MKQSRTLIVLFSISLLIVLLQANNSHLRATTPGHYKEAKGVSIYPKGEDPNPKIIYKSVNLVKKDSKPVTFPEYEYGYVPDTFSWYIGACLKVPSESLSIYYDKEEFHTIFGEGCSKGEKLYKYAIPFFDVKTIEEDKQGSAKITIIKKGQQGHSNLELSFNIDLATSELVIQLKKEAQKFLTNEIIALYKLYKTGELLALRNKHKQKDIYTMTLKKQFFNPFKKVINLDDIRNKIEDIFKYKVNSTYAFINAIKDYETEDDIKRVQATVDMIEEIEKKNPKLDRDLAEFIKMTPKGYQDYKTWEEEHAKKEAENKRLQEAAAEEAQKLKDVNAQNKAHSEWVREARDRREKEYEEKKQKDAAANKKRKEEIMEDELREIEELKSEGLTQRAKIRQAEFDRKYGKQRKFKKY